ncbi:hypothetical protein PspLS_05893 [Pyricularia sp. CBS 133598]|nr:hypothetical protein PspLS_05893 [Pyricularia sp. CBS 133598]
MAHIMQILGDAGVLQLLGPVDVNHRLFIHWPNSPPLEPGQTIPGNLVSAAQQQPKISTDFQGGSSGYLLMMLAQYPGNGFDNQICHWVVTGVPVSQNDVAVDQGKTIAPYMPPRMGQEQARFIFLLLNPRPGVMFNAATIIHDLGGMIGMGPPRLHAREFLASKGLEVVAASVLMG